jgi:hypothetical protein
MMARFEAVFYEGDDDRLPAWEVVEWTFDNGQGNRSGRTVETFRGANAEEDAYDIAAFHNDMLLNPFESGCEFDGVLA